MRSFSILPVLIIFMLSLIFQPGGACAEEDTDTPGMMNTNNTGPPPPLDEYNNIPPGLLMSDDTIPAQPIQDTAQSDADVMTMDEIVDAYDKGRYEVVARHLLPIATNNYPQAQELLGIMYYKGQGVTQDYESAIEWLTKAAESGRPLAEHYLATLILAGNGTTADPPAALMWLYIAAVHYPEGAEKNRTIQDRNNLASRLSRRDRMRAFELARDWLKKKDEAALFEEEAAP